MKLFSILLLLLSLNATAAEQMLQESQYRYVQMSIGKGKPFFLEVGAESCHSCVVMGKMLYKIVKKHPEYNIHFINVQKERNAAYELKVRMIPTQIIFDKNGKEVYRHIGVLSSDELNKLFQTYSF